MMTKEILLYVSGETGDSNEKKKKEKESKKKKRNVMTMKRERIKTGHNARVSDLGQFRDRSRILPFSSGQVLYSYPNYMQISFFFFRFPMDTVSRQSPSDAKSPLPVRGISFKVSSRTATTSLCVLRQSGSVKLQTSENAEDSLFKKRARESPEVTCACVYPRRTSSTTFPSRNLVQDDHTST